MVHSCAVYGCGSSAKFHKFLRFHRFPRDARSRLWIEACQRPELKHKNINQLYNMYICSLHFEKWMYNDKKLKCAAIPVLNLPSAYPMSTQRNTATEQASKLEVQRSLHGIDVENQIEVTSVGVVSDLHGIDVQNQVENTSVGVVRGLHGIDVKNQIEVTSVGVVRNLHGIDVESQTEVTSVGAVRDLHGIGVQNQIELTSVGGSVAASTSAQTSQTTKKFTDHTPRKRKLPKDLKSSPKKLKLMEDAQCTDVTRQQFLQECDKFLSPNLSKIVKFQANFKPNSRNNIYSKEFKLFCLNIYYSSPQPYKFLSKTLCLPSKRTLATLAIPVGTKISDYIWGVLSQVIKYLSPFERECTFCMDEISLNCSLFYDIHRDKIIGLHETDNIQGPYAAEYAFTIMLRGILGDWEQVVGYAFITTSNIDESLEEWIDNTIKQLFALGFKIRAVVSNQRSNFVKFSKTRGVSKDQPYFEIDGKKVYYIFDVPHLIKCVRNNLINYDFEFNGKTASWNDINKCYQLDKQKDFRCASKLTDSHISPKSFQKQKVRLATQVLSNSVKTAVETYAKAGDLNPCDGTVEFIDTMDKLFDLLNSSNPISSKPYNKPYRDDELQRNLLLKAHNLLSSLKVRQKNTGEDVTTTIKFINAFAITINAIIQIYDDLKKESGFNEFYLLTRRLNIENLENFFGIIRQACGNCWEPTCIQFERAFQRSFLCQTLKLCSKANCADDFENILSQYSDFIQNKSTVVARRTTETIPTNFDIPEKNSFLYICDYVLRRCVDRHKCSSTINYVSTFTDKPSRDSFGELHSPPADFVDYCNELENLFTQNFCSFVGNNILKKLLNILSKVEFKSRPCSCFPQTLMLKLFIRMRIHNMIKFYNRKLKTSKKVSRK